MMIVANPSDCLTFQTFSSMWRWMSHSKPLSIHHNARIGKRRPQMKTSFRCQGVGDLRLKAWRCWCQECIHFIMRKGNTMINPILSRVDKDPSKMLWKLYSYTAFSHCLYIRHDHPFLFRPSHRKHTTCTKLWPDLLINELLAETSGRTVIGDVSLTLLDFAMAKRSIPFNSSMSFWWLLKCICSFCWIGDRLFILTCLV